MPMERECPPRLLRDGVDFSPQLVPYADRARSGISTSAKLLATGLCA